MKTFQGTFVALATPFRQGVLDEAAYRRLIRHLIQNGIDGLVPMGTTGESVTMTFEERAAAIAVAVEEAQGKAMVVAGAGSNSTAESIKAVKVAKDAGADAAMVVTPYYNKPTQTGLVEHFRLIAQANPGFPLLAYNVPGRTGVDLLPDTYPRLAEVREVVAVKEATGSLARLIDIREKVGDRFDLLTGDDFTIHPFIASGGKGVISVSGNVVPLDVSKLVKAALAHDNVTARDLQVRLNRLHRLLFVESNPIPVKWALHLMGYFSPEIRPPLTVMTEANAAQLRDELARLGLFSS